MSNLQLALPGLLTDAADWVWRDDDFDEVGAALEPGTASATGGIPGRASEGAVVVTASARTR